VARGAGSPYPAPLNCHCEVATTEAIPSHLFAVADKTSLITGVACFYASGWKVPLWDDILRPPADQDSIHCSLGPLGPRSFTNVTGVDAEGGKLI
jgi:hypothetical protein